MKNIKHGDVALARQIFNKFGPMVFIGTQRRGRYYSEAIIERQIDDEIMDVLGKYVTIGKINKIRKILREACTPKSLKDNPDKISDLVRSRLDEMAGIEDVF